MVTCGTAAHIINEHLDQLIISILNSKGGSGKTTITTNLARAFQLAGSKVLIVDSDPQGTAADWIAMQDESSDQPGVVTISTPATMQRDLKQVGSAFDHVLIDGAAKMVEELAAAAVVAADVVLIPCRPSPADLWGSAPVVELIKARQMITGGTPAAAFVVNAGVVGTHHAAEIGDALDGYGLPVLDARLHQRVAYAEALARGCTVLDLPDAQKAAAEVEALRNEILNTYG